MEQEIKRCDRVSESMFWSDSNGGRGGQGREEEGQLDQWKRILEIVKEILSKKTGQGGCFLVFCSEKMGSFGKNVLLQERQKKAREKDPPPFHED